MPIQVPMLKQRAGKTALKLNTEFTPVNGWLNEFRKHAGFSYRTMSREFKV
jgi:hypothetical protein